MATVLREVAGLQGDFGRVRGRGYDLSFNSATTYATGGISIPARSVGLMSVYGMSIIGAPSAEAGKYVALYRTDTNKLQLFFVNTTPGAPLIEVTNGTTITDYKVRLFIQGI